MPNGANPQLLKLHLHRLLRTFVGKSSRFPHHQTSWDIISTLPPTLRLSPHSRHKGREQPPHLLRMTGAHAVCPSPQVASDTAYTPEPQLHAASDFNAAEEDKRLKLKSHPATPESIERDTENLMPLCVHRRHMARTFRRSLMAFNSIISDMFYL